MIKNITKTVKNLFKEGVYVTFRKIKSKISEEKIQNQYGCINPTLTLEEKSPQLTSAISGHRIAWILPEFSEGSGGHRTILRHINFFEQKGLFSDVYVFYKNLWGSSEQTRNRISKHFQIELTSCNFFELKSGDIDSQIKQDYSIVFATNWESAYMVANFSRCFKKVYFIQDFEPSFFALGSNYCFAEQTYKFRFDMALTAGDWLKTVMEKNYQLPSTSFGFGYDKSVYFLKEKIESKNTKTIFYYARPITERRGFELAINVLYVLSQKRKDIKIITAGWDLSTYKIPFEYENHKKVSPSELVKLYQISNVAIVISLTNLSLLPFEVAASGCPVLMNDGPNTEWIDPQKEMFYFSNATVNEFVTKIEYILDHPKEIEERQIKINEYLKTVSWEKEIEKSYNSIKDMLESNK